VKTAILIVAVVVLVIALYVRAARAPLGQYVDFSKPPWSDAAKSAREIFNIAKALNLENPGRVAVKFPLRSTTGDTEHVWGELLSASDSDFAATFEGPLAKGTPAQTSPLRVPIGELEDWLFVQDDGSVRGGFTTRIEIEQALSSGRPLPEHMQAMRGRFVDI
jgi:uncharacterized protein YegJ (DUF2314 family)